MGDDLSRKKKIYIITRFACVVSNCINKKNHDVTKTFISSMKARTITIGFGSASNCGPNNAVSTSKGRPIVRDVCGAELARAGLDCVDLSKGTRKIRDLYDGFVS